MISVKSFVTEHVVDFIMILEEDFPRQLLTLFSRALSAFQYDIIGRIPELLSFVYMSYINYFRQCLFFTSGQSV